MGMFSREESEMACQAIVDSISAEAMKQVKAAEMEAILYGCGYLRVTHEGVTHIPRDQIIQEIMSLPEIVK